VIPLSWTFSLRFPRLGMVLTAPVSRDKVMPLHLCCDPGGGDSWSVIELVIWDDRGEEFEKLMGYDPTSVTPPHR
jgi:hypothetical protein